MDDHQFDERLRHSGAQVRTTAPDPHETAEALAAVQAHRTSTSWIAPAAILGVAAAVVGLLVWLARPSDEAEAPAPADTSPDSVQLVPESAEPIHVGELAIDWSEQHDDWDGRGGRCLTVEARGEEASGCFEGSRAGMPLIAAVGDGPVALSATSDSFLIGTDPFGEDPSCDPGALDEQRLYEISCDGGITQVRELPVTPTHGFTPIHVRGSSFEFENVRVEGVRGVLAYLSRPSVGDERCLVLLHAGRPGWWEACGTFSDGDQLAVGVDGAVWVVDVSTERVRIVSAATSASIHGCIQTMTEILARLDRVSMADGVACSDRRGVVTTPRKGVSMIDAGAPASQVCFGASGCPEPSSMLEPLPIASGSAYRPATREVGVDDLTGEIGAITFPPGADAAGIGAAVGEHFQDPGEGPGSLVREVDVADPHGLVLVEVAVLDDAAGPDTYAVWLDDTEGVLAIDRLFRIRTCGRGVDPASGLCV